MNEQESRRFHQEQRATSEDYNKRFNDSAAIVFDKVIEGRRKKAFEDKVYIATIGFSHSGKSTVARTLQERFPQLIRIETDQIHEVINSNFPQLKDDNTVEGEGYWLRQAITGELREKVIGELAENGWWIINDSANLQKEERAKRINVPKQKGYKTILIWLKTSEEELLKRLKAADETSVSSGGKAAYLDLYEKVQKQRIDTPTQEEADVLLAFEIVDDSAIDKIVQELDKFTI